jgi:hypothetical protein
MAQHDYDIANQSFPAFRTDLNGVLEAINTSNSGSSRPSSAVAGTIWLDTSGGATAHILKFYDGGADINLATINTTANTVDFADSSVTFDIVNDTSPQLGGNLDTNSQNIVIDDAHGILDENNNEQLIFQTTASAVNQFDITNAATSNNPSISATGGDTNIGINLIPKGTGVLQANGNAVKVAGKETIWIPASAMYGATTNPADAQQVETTATRPDMKVLDFDASTDEFAQFSVAFPKSWNEGTITYQVYWTPASTNTGNCIFGLQGVSCGDNDTIDIAYGTAINVTDAGIGTVEDQQVTAESSAVTIAGTPAVDQLTYFQLFRDANAGGDTFSADARVLGIKIFFTTDAANDA